PRLPDVPGLTPPARPGSPAPQAGIQAAIDEHQQLVALAKHIASLEGHVVGLTHHAKEYLHRILGDEEAVKTLADAGFVFCSEADPRKTRLRDSTRLFGSQFTQTTAEQANVEMSRAENLMEQSVAAIKKVIPIHQVGDLFISVEEALTVTRAHFGKP